MRIMRNRRKHRAAALCLLLLTAMLSACGEQTQEPAVPVTAAPPEATADGQTKTPDNTAVDFSNGNFDFLRVYSATPGGPEVKLSLITQGESQAVRAEITGKGAPAIAVDASSLLGDNVAKLREMQLVVGVERADGEFHAVSGTVTALSGADRAESADPWSVYLPTKNPNTVRAVLDEGTSFVPGAYNMFIIRKAVDNALDRGLPQSNLIIYSIEFFDEYGEPIPVDADARFSAPEGFGELDMSNLAQVSGEELIPGAEGTSAGWGQAFALPTVKNGGVFDADALTPQSVITVYYNSETPPELILQSWTDGAPEGSGWAKVAPRAVNDSNGIAQYAFADMAAAFGTEDFGTYLDQIYVGDTGNDLTVAAVSIGEESGRTAADSADVLGGQ
jgi:hypothetical protein